MLGINIGEAVIMSNVESAVELFINNCNCAQAILLTYGTKFGLTDEQAYKLGTGFGGGLGRHGDVCGAVSGAVMVIGLKYGMAKPDDNDARTKTFEVVSEFLARFSDHQASILCRELLGCDLSTTQGRDFASEKELFATKCPEFVREAAKLLEEIL